MGTKCSGGILECKSVSQKRRVAPEQPYYRVSPNSVVVLVRVFVVVVGMNCCCCFAVLVLGCELLLVGLDAIQTH